MSRRGKHASNLARLRGRIAGLALAAKHDPRDYTANARKRFMARFKDEVDPGRILPQGRACEKSRSG